MSEAFYSNSNPQAFTTLRTQQDGGVIDGTSRATYVPCPGHVILRAHILERLVDSIRSRLWPKGNKVVFIPGMDRRAPWGSIGGAIHMCMT